MQNNWENGSFMWIRKLWSNVGTILVLSLALIAPVTASRADSGKFSVIEVGVDSNFRQNLTFRIKARSEGAKIVAAAVLFRGFTANPATAARYPLEPFTPANEVDLRYVEPTISYTTPPWDMFVYRWELIDEAGNKFVTEDHQGEYADTTRDWKVLEGDRSIVYWYGQDEAFGKRLLYASEFGMAETERRTGFKLPIKLRVAVYNSQADYCTFYAASSCILWVGGQAWGTVFTAWWGKAVEEPNVQFGDAFLYDLIPHEISHCFLGVRMGSRIGAIPSWFNEGQAMNNERPESIDANNTRVRELAAQGKIERLDVMEARTTISRDRLDAVQDWYATATSLVSFLYEEYGEDVLGKIIDSVMEGRSFEQSIKEVTGMSMLEYETAWLKWLGAPATLPTPAPTETFFLPPTPSPYPTRTPRP